MSRLILNVILISLSVFIYIPQMHWWYKVTIIKHFILNTLFIFTPLITRHHNNIMRHMLLHLLLMMLTVNLLGVFLVCVFSEDVIFVVYRPCAYTIYMLWGFRHFTGLRDLSFWLICLGSHLPKAINALVLISIYHISILIFLMLVVKMLLLIVIKHILKCLLILVVLTK